IHGAVHERFAGGHPVSFVHVHMFALGNKVFFFVSHAVLDEDTAHALHETTELRGTVDFADDRLFLRLPRLKQFGHSRETARDVLGFRCFARYLDQDIAREYLIALVHENVGSCGQEVACDDVGTRQAGSLAMLILDRDARPEVLIRIVDNYLPRETGNFIHFLAHGHAFDDITESDLAADFRENRQGVRIPLNKLLADIHFLPVLDFKPSAVDDRIFFLLTTRFIVNGDTPASGHDHVVAFLVFHRIQVEIFDSAGILGFKYGLLNNLACRTADVERSHRELRARLADGLGGYDTDSLADIYEFAAAEVSTIAHLADAA